MRKKPNEFHFYTPAEIRFIKKRITGRTYKELTELFNKHFGLTLTVVQIRSTANNRELSNSLPKNTFQKGYTNWVKGTHIATYRKRCGSRKGIPPIT